MNTQLHEEQDHVLTVAHETVALLRSDLPVTPDAHGSEGLRVSALALGRLGRLLNLQADVLADDDDASRLVARAVVETWITGHGALLLGTEGIGLLDARSKALATPSSPATAEQRWPSLLDIARRLDAQMYGTSEPPRAFQRHVSSFFDEIDISGVEGTLACFSPVPDVEQPSTNRRDHYLRVSLWVVLFLAHDYFAAAGAAGPARAARALFDRLRRLTDEFYAQRRNTSLRPPGSG